MSAAQLYTTVVLAHMPGLLALALWRKCWHFPILAFAFFGMLAFNAAGSISVFSEAKIYSIAIDTNSISIDLALILIYQALAFYLTAGIYISLRTPPTVVASATILDAACVIVIASLILILGYLYFLDTGTFLILASLDGSMNIDTALSFREKYVYGLNFWPFYNLGFVFLPILLSTYGLILVKESDRHRALFWLAIVVSFGASLSLGSKGGIVNFVLSLGVAYAVHSGMTGKPVFSIFHNRNFLLFFAFAVALLVAGYLWATPDGIQAQSLLQRFWYRIFVAYPEALGTSISYANEHGTLGMAAMPTLRGLLQHEQLNLSLMLHSYLAGTPGGLSIPMAGELFATAGWPGVLLVIPVIYVVLALLQEFAFCLTEGLLSIVFSALYGYLAINVFLNGMFSSLFNFMYPGTLLLIGMIITMLMLIRKTMLKMLKL